jgi:exopolysaccharide/PEP-CTERM locus tyrosine autokinase
MKPDFSPPAQASLIERAAEVYDLGDVFRRQTMPDGPAVISDPVEPKPLTAEPDAVPAIPTEAPSPVRTIDIALLRDNGFIEPGAAPTSLSEEFRLAKRPLMLGALGGRSAQPLDRGRAILVSSAQPDEGKTFCALNLALSLSQERDIEVLLVDADVAKPQIPAMLGIEAERGLIDALADPSIDIESLVIDTSIPKFSILSAGRRSSQDTELLASARTAEIIDAMLAHNPARLVLFDTPPVLAASPASALAPLVGQVVLVVRADRTREPELREAVALLEGNPRIQMLLNGATYAGSNHKYGSYYGPGGQ